MVASIQWGGCLEEFIAFFNTELDMPDWVSIAPVIRRQDCIHVHEAPSGGCKKFP
jgi:hypothetical protein